MASNHTADEHIDPRNVHGHDDHGGHDDDTPHGSLRDYVIGFVLSVTLTAVPFWLVMADPLANKTATVLLVVAFAFVQILVHMVYFLHMNTRSEGGWNMLALIFTAVLVVITLSGSLWVMYHMNTNMMPTMTHDPRTAP
jgi:cytochrome o ubiquinol oxidase operon protein cyoD